MNKPRKFAAFDIDGTIARSSLFLQVVNELFRQGHLPRGAHQNITRKYQDYQERAHPNAFEEYSQLSVSTLFENLSTVTVAHYKQAVDTVISEIASHTYVYTRNMISRLHSEGYFLIALSGSEMYAVEQFTRQFSFDIAIGESYHEKEGYFTGEVEQVVYRKDLFLKRFAKDHNLTFKDSFALGDSMGDVSMLELVENPIAFNPEDKLYQHARSQGWKIVVERKNVMYELTSDGSSYTLQ